jgi:hypothetical protein
MYNLENIERTMEKKKYISPETMVYEMESEMTLLALSIDKGLGGPGIADAPMLMNDMDDFEEYEEEDYEYFNEYEW